jgi:hypothetical protein
MNCRKEGTAKLGNVLDPVRWFHLYVNAVYFLVQALVLRKKAVLSNFLSN